MNTFRVHPIIHEYSENYTPFWDKNPITKFATQFIACKKPSLDKGYNLQKEVDHHLDLDESRLQLR